MFRQLPFADPAMQSLTYASSQHAGKQYQAHRSYDIPTSPDVPHRNERTPTRARPRHHRQHRKHNDIFHTAIAFLPEVVPRRRIQGISQSRQSITGRRRHDHVCLPWSGHLSCASWHWALRGAGALGVAWRTANGIQQM